MLKYTPAADLINLWTVENPTADQSMFVKPIKRLLLPE